MTTSEDWHNRSLWLGSLLVAYFGDRYQTGTKSFKMFSCITAILVKKMLIDFPITFKLFSCNNAAYSKVLQTFFALYCIINVNFCITLIFVPYSILKHFKTEDSMPFFSSKIKLFFIFVFVGSMAKWLIDIDSVKKPTGAILLCPSEKVLYGTFPCLTVLASSSKFHS